MSHVVLDVTVLLLCTITNVATVGRVIRHRSVDGLAISWVLLTMFACLSWTVYGTWQGNIFQVITSAMTATCFCIVLINAHLMSAVRAAHSLISIVGFVLALAAVAIFVGVHGLGLVGLGLTLVNRIPQLAKAIRYGRGVAISLLGNGADALQSLLWVMIGAVRLDYWLAASSAYCLFSAAFVVIRCAPSRGVIPAFWKTAESKPAATATAVS